MPSPARSQLWALLYAQVTQADGAQQRNILLDRIRLGRRDDSGEALAAARGIGTARWTRTRVEAILTTLALPPNAPLSTVVVETLPNIANLQDPLGGDVGHVRILRTSPLVAIPPIC